MAPHRNTIVTVGDFVEGVQVRNAGLRAEAMALQTGRRRHSSHPTGAIGMGRPRPRLGPFLV